jgi:ectoine hydroxylase-related dioxygenase (phytanoyl-CoA dioxygenase family)
MYAQIENDVARRLREDGFVILRDLISEEEVARYAQRVEELFALEGEHSGSEFKQEPGTRRLANCVNKGEIFEKAIENPVVLECVQVVLGSDFKLSSFNIRSANPRSNCGQPLHADSGAVADEQGYWVCNSVWMLDDFTESNGALRVVPGSHRWRRLPEPGAKVPGEMLVTGRAGTVVVMNAHMWHGGTDNRTGLPRRAMHVYFTRGDKPQQQYQKKLVGPEVQARLGPLARKLLALDDPRNDEMAESGAGKSGFLR